MAVLFQEIIRKKRDGAVLSTQEITQFVEGITSGAATDAHIAAFAMAVYFKGLNKEETVALTMAMRDSGDVMAWPDLQNPVVDKHSTGGVGDNVSLMLAPMAAACGLNVPMISGRGLGHTGGTLDKMDSIPGYTSQPNNDLFLKVTKDIGCAIIGQTANLAPADKRFYAVRDVTATVENLSLITASILSKKLAAGLGWLVLDVKFGNGAFMDDLDKARALAQSLVSVANGAGTKTVALLTDMNEPLASAVGNAVEVTNAVEFLNGTHRDKRLLDVTLSLVTQMVCSARGTNDHDGVMREVRARLDDGSAARKFGAMVSALGGPADFMQHYKSYLPIAPVQRDVVSKVGGYISAVDTRAIGVAVVEMGGGRQSSTDTIDHRVGFTGLLPIGSKVTIGQRLGTVHALDQAMADRAAGALLSAYILSDVTPQTRPVIAERID
ncbi:MAG: thymidine phosphorylase [Ahrensia sp.]|nr:thymidine phosphorylase [Ahrensia sp.]